MGRIFKFYNNFNNKYDEDNNLDIEFIRDNLRLIQRDYDIDFKLFMKNCSVGIN